jgi:LacI family transcriptional regulator
VPRHSAGPGDPRTESTAVPPPNVKDVAALAGVSIGTVSNVLNRPAQVSEPTRLRVLAAIQELGFVRNDAARRLRGAGSRTLAYVVLDAANPFFTDVARGVQDAADGADLVLYLCDTGQGIDRQNAYLDLLEQQRVMGILITPLDPLDARISSLSGRGMPVVLVDRVAGPELCSVTDDDVLGGEVAVTHLLETGHRRIAFIGGPRRIGQVADRITGAEQAIRTAGTGELLVMETDTLNITEGRRAGERLAGLPAARRPTAAFCGNDLVALGLLQQMVQLGIRVPDELAIVGYDDVEYAQAAAVPLTSVSQPRQLLGRTATELLLAEAAGDPGHRHRQVVFSPELVVRASTLLR